MKQSTLKMRRWRKKNRRRQRENDRRWRERNPEKAKAKQRRWYRENRERELQRNRIYCKKNKKKVAARRRLYKHNMTQREHDQRMKEQRSRCAICRKRFVKTPHIDHCHKTNKNRGLLCDDCNLGLGRFKDSPKILRSAIKYLRRHNGH